MAHWVLEDENGITFDLTGHANTLFGKSIILDNDTFINRVQEIKKSYTDGSVVPGVSIFDSKIINFNCSITLPTDAAFRELTNELIYNLRKAAFIIETDEGIKTSVKYKDTKIPYGIGGHKRDADASFSFTQLTPYWESTTATTGNGSGTDIEIDLNNGGSLVAFGSIELTTALLNTRFAVWVSETAKGIDITDLSFGEPVNELFKYIINNDSGNAILSNGSDIVLDRNNRILNGTSFFSFPVGDFKLNITALESVDVVVTFYKRFYI